MFSSTFVTKSPPRNKMVNKKATPFLDHFLLSSMLFYISILAAPTQVGSTSYASISFDASMFPSAEYYDYIIIGGGTAGCPLAATLSESYRVLLLERGGSPQEFPDVMAREGFQRTLVSANTRDSPAQAFTSTDGVTNARGRVLGGSSAINAGFYSRGDDAFFKGGCGPVEWDMVMVNGSYEWVERAVTFVPREVGRWQMALRDALVTAEVLPYNGFTVNHVKGTKIGASTFDTDGKRHTAADLLQFAREANIRVGLRATVDRILLSGPSVDDARIRATGVVYTDRFGRQHWATTNDGGEVILCAGAIGSPQLLLLSGIGPWQRLVYRRIPVVRHQPYVGEFMYDNPRNGISIFSPVPLHHSLIQVVGITDDGAFIEGSSNIVPSFRAPVATVMEKVSGPLSRGTLWLTSLDVRDNPAVRFNYFNNNVDLARCVDGLRKLGEVMDSQPMEVFKFPNSNGSTSDFRYVGSPLPENLSEDAVMEAFCRGTVVTMWHYHGGCVAGKVVDEEFRVIGVDSLRVVDGSTFLRSPGTNPQATVMMMGRYVGLRMKEERRNRE